MKKILGALAVSTALFIAPQSASAEIAPLCQANEPASVGVRCAGGSGFCQVWVYVADNDLTGRQRVCI